MSLTKRIVLSPLALERLLALEIVPAVVLLSRCRGGEKGRYMAHLQEVRVGVYPLERFQSLVPRKRMRKSLVAARNARNRLSKRVVWNINSTAVGGGVAEMLHSLLGYTRSVGIDSRWLVISGNPGFFHVTKRLHHALHGEPGDGSELGAEARAIYEDTLRENALELASVVRPRDIVILHDPQTAGLARSLRNAGAHVIWRCHIGRDDLNEEAARGWEFLAPYLEEISLFVFSRQTYVPKACEHGDSVVIQPSIDVFSPKNQDLSENAPPRWVRACSISMRFTSSLPPASTTRESAGSCNIPAST